MAYDINLIGGYGTGALGDVTDPAGQICSYANVASVTEVAAAYNAVTINAPSNGAYETFEVGAEIMLHVSGCSGGDTAEWLGRYMVCKITAVQTSVLSSAGKILVLDKNITDLLPVEQFINHIVQAITVPQFNILAITGTVSPIAYDVTNKYGGILPVKCKSGLTLSGSGAINLVDKGIPIANKALRYWTKQECAAYNRADVTVTTSDNGLLDTDKYSAWENHITVRQLLLNAGDGATVIWARRITNTDSATATRIGGTAAGAQFSRANNLGGSTIMLAADDMDGFVPSLISKTKGAGQGLGRCYIALKNSVLRNDEGLYAFDIVSDPARVMKKLNIKDYGSGRHGDVTNPTQALNNYARVTKIDGGGKMITYTNLTTTGLAGFDDGALVMFHVSKHKTTDKMAYLAKFILAKVAHHYTLDGVLILDTDVAKVLPASELANYDCQIISVFEAANLMINTNYNATTTWDDVKKTGGLCAISCKGKCDIKDGKINVEGKGGGTAYARDGLAFIGNAQMCDRLPMGQGHGSVFLLANNVKINKNSRIGATYSGANFGGAGKAGIHGSVGAKYGGGYAGLRATSNYGNDSYGGSMGLIINQLSKGAHVFIVANTLQGMYLAAISTGSAAGNGGFYSTTSTMRDTENVEVFCGGAGYAGGGGGGNDATTSDKINGTGGGGGGYAIGGYAGQDGYGNFAESAGISGWAFLYINEVAEFDNTGVVAV